MASENMIDVTDDTFEKEVIEKSKEIPVVVDFWAEWCGPCQMLTPVLDKVAEQYKDKVAFVKLSTEENSKKAEEYDVSSIPDVKLFKDGKVVDTFIGAIPESQIKDFIDKNL